jgi:hypothetical protein
MNSSKRIGKFSCSLELQPVISQTQPVHLELPYLLVLPDHWVRPRVTDGLPKVRLS